MKPAHPHVTTYRPRHMGCRTQDVLALDERHQAALIRILQTAAPSGVTGAPAVAVVSAPMSTALLLPLLRLLTRASSPSVRCAAGEVGG